MTDKTEPQDTPRRLVRIEHPDHGWPTPTSAWSGESAARHRAQQVHARWLASLQP